MKIITNERKFVALVIREKTVGEKPSETIRLLSKYYFGIGLSKEEVKIKTIELFRSDKLLKFKIEDWEVLFDKIIKKVSRYEDDKMHLCEVDKINITKNELYIINSLDNIKLEKLAFVLLVHCKVNNAMKNNDQNWVNSSVESIYTDAKLTGGYKVQRPLRHDLLNRGLISAPRVGSLNVKYVDENSDTVFIINDFTDFVDNYLKWKGVIKSIQCECGIFVSTTSNSRKYCDECIVIHRNEKQKDRDKNKRHEKYKSCK